MSNDNPFSEALFRTCKYAPTWPTRGFASIEAARSWVAGFVGWYNTEHRHSAIRFVTPEQRHRGEDRALLASRHQVYERARAAQPERWSGRTPNARMLGTEAMGAPTRSPMKLAAATPWPGPPKAQREIECRRQLP